MSTPGIYYRYPRTSDPGAFLLKLSDVMLTTVNTFPSGYSINKDKVVFTDNMNTVITIAPDGQQKNITASGLYQMGRPTLSPDGLTVAVQASEDPAVPANSLNIYTVSLANGAWQRISNLPVNEEAPRWFPRSNKVAYTSFSPTDGINIHIYDVSAQREVMQIGNMAGGLSLAITADEKYILSPSLMRIYDLQTGNMTTDLRPTILTALTNAGFEQDTRFPGQANRGTYTLDGSFSPDGKTIVFDGAVKRGTSYGLIMARINVDGTGFTLLSDIIPNTPSFSNNNNYSQINPYWLGE